MTANLLSVLQDADIFSGMSEESGDLLLEYFEWVSVHAGQEIIREGDIATFGLLIISGSFEIMKWLKGQKVALAVVGRGGFVGDVSLLSANHRYASCRAIASGTIGILSRQRLQEMHSEAPSLYAELLVNFNRVLSRRLLQINDDIVNFSDGCLPSEIAKRIAFNSILT